MEINNETHQLIKSVSIEALLGRRDAAVEKLSQAFTLIEEARELYEGMLGEIEFESKRSLNSRKDRLFLSETRDLHRLVRTELRNVNPPNVILGIT